MGHRAGVLLAMLLVLPGTGWAHVMNMTTAYLTMEGTRVTAAIGVKGADIDRALGSAVAGNPVYLALDTDAAVPAIKDYACLQCRIGSDRRQVARLVDRWKIALLVLATRYREDHLTWRQILLAITQVVVHQVKGLEEVLV